MGMFKTMTINEASIHKKELEDKIYKLILDFQQTTSLQVASIERIYIPPSHNTGKDQLIGIAIDIAL